MREETHICSKKDTESTLHEVLTQYLFFSNYILHVQSNFLTRTSSNQNS